MEETSENRLIRAEFPRSNRYPADWVLRNAMGPNPLWLAEWLTEWVTLEPGMRVLDLGCGKAITSVMLARESGARVWAADWWVDPAENWARIEEAGAAEQVIPLRVEAHALPFPEGFFDVILSIDAYHYFGTDELYLFYLSRFVRAGGLIGIAVPGLTRLFPGAPPGYLTEPMRNGKVFWEDECIVFHTADWWRDLWTRSGRLKAVRADVMPEGWKHWRDFEIALEASGASPFPSDAEALDADQGNHIGFVRVVGIRNDVRGLDLYDPAILSKM